MCERQSDCECMCTFTLGKEERGDRIRKVHGHWTLQLPRRFSRNPAGDPQSTAQYSPCLLGENYMSPRLFLLLGSWRGALPSSHHPRNRAGAGIKTTFGVLGLVFNYRTHIPTLLDMWWGWGGKGDDNSIKQTEPEPMEISLPGTKVEVITT
jgi:hypothetical protein